MLLDKEVEIKTHNTTIKYWLNLGYNIINIGDVIKVNPEHLKPNSKIKVNCLCSNCNNKTFISYMSYYNSINNGDGSYVCSKCNIVKTKKTLKEKYGETNPSHIKKFKDKRQKTFNDIWNGHPMYNEKIKEKIKDTNLERYNTENVLQNEEIKNVIKKTNLERYGFENPSSNELIKNKKKQTLKTNFPDPSVITNKIKETINKIYGVDHPLQSDIIKEKLKNTNKKKYGCEYGLQSNQIKEKIKETNLKKYGVDNPFKLKNKIKEVSKISSIKEYNLFFKRIGYSLADKETFNNNTILKLYHDECANNFEITYKMFYDRYRNNSIICTLCNPKHNTISTPENDIVSFIKANYSSEIIQSDRSILNGKELDIYIPDLKIAFEFNGLYWHSELEKPNNYHLKKTELCIEKGIHLIHIFEDDWYYKQDIVKSRILNLIKCSMNKLYARKCQIKELKNKETKKFLNENHIQGYINSKINIGLYYEDKLVSLMCFGALRKNMNNNNQVNCYEMYRFCNILNTNVIGSASKLFKYFIKKYNPIEVISYADRSWSIGNLYIKLGFDFLHNTEPNYYYIIDNIRENRFKYRKDVLVKEGFDKNKSEREIMLERGYYRIYNSGSMKFSYKKMI